ncbi:Os07g0193500 [Oryza sativa Japonica Group]|uniref:Os07g0193500 protein n=5 Tax=Oryza TaxID=4527 RepID=B9FVZ4_ORYSJ|nr:hypothetical protein OsI_25236 [Oryza sativa Indica Group]EEE66731.1 hypothetical protein OsJ_23421 [Oryza sativa Japonica Group]BAT00447.1 Os07g0193500 [Oryza sativa Japonica Group]
MHSMMMAPSMQWITTVVRSCPLCVLLLVQVTHWPNGDKELLHRRDVKYSLTKALVAFYPFAGQLGVDGAGHIQIDYTGHVPPRLRCGGVVLSLASIARASAEALLPPTETPHLYRDSDVLRPQAAHHMCHVYYARSLGPLKQRRWHMR